MTRFIALLTATSALALAASPASATGKMTCDAPKESWQQIDTLKSKLSESGWAVRKAKVDGGCYEVYATDPEGRRVEAYFHPVTFKKLLVSQRGKTIFKAD